MQDFAGISLHVNANYFLQVFKPEDECALRIFVVGVLALPCHVCVQAEDVIVLRQANGDGGTFVVAELMESGGRKFVGGAVEQFRHDHVGLQQGLDLAHGGRRQKL